MKLHNDSGNKNDLRGLNQRPVTVEELRVDMKLPVNKHSKN